MVDLTKYGPVSVLLLKMEPRLDSEGTRANLESMWSKDYQVLTAFLERKETVIRRKSVELTISPSSIHTIIAIEPIGENTVLLLWQDHEQAAQNPVAEG